MSKDPYTQDQQHQDLQCDFGYLKGFWSFQDLKGFWSFQDFQGFQDFGDF